jgi:hypothetical protein
VPIAIDASTPVEVKLSNSTSATATTASFTPPAGSLVVIEIGLSFNSNTTTAPTFTVSDSHSNSFTAGPFAFDLAANGTWQFRFYYATAPGATTVTATRAGQLGATMYYIKTTVLTGAAASQTGAASNSAHAQTGTSLTVAITPTVIGSWIMVNAGSGNTPYTASNLTQDTFWADSSDGAAAATGHAVSASLSSVTLGWTVGVSQFWSVAAWEVLPAPSGLIPQQLKARVPVMGATSKKVLAYYGR